MGKNQIALDILGKLKLDAEAAKKSLDQVQSEASKIQLGAKDKGSFDKIFKQAEEDYKHFQSLISKGGSEPKDLKVILSAAEKMRETFAKLGVEVHDLTGKEGDALKKLVPKDIADNIDKAEKKLKAVNENLEQQRKLEENVSKATQKKTDAEKSYQKVLDQTKKFEKVRSDKNEAKKKYGEYFNVKGNNEGQLKQTEQYKELTNQAKEAEEAIQRATQAFEEAHRTKSGSQDKRFKLENDQGYKDAVAKKNTSDANLQKFIEDAEKAKVAYENALATFNQTPKPTGLAALSRAVEDNRNKVELAQKALDEFTQSGKTTIGIEALKASLQTLGVDTTDCGDDVGLLTQKLEQFKSEAQSNVIAAIKAIGQAEKQTGEASGRMAEDINKGTTAIEQMDAAAADAKAFQSRLTQFFSLTNGVQLLKRAVTSAYDTIKDLDAVMTETAVVTDFSVGDMWDQLPEYTQRANELGISIHSAYEAATLYYQQGLSTNEVMAVSNETLKMARIAGLEAADATDRMTNAMRGFNMAITEANAQNVNDVYSNLAAKTASNVDEISTAMTKVASLANNANMSFENTAAFLSQIIETTRESAETAGTALKTVIARFSEVKELRSKGELTGTDEEGQEIDVNKVSKALRSAGIDLNEYFTGAKGLDEIFLELAKRWSSLDQVQQRYIATMAAGSRQQSRFIALMSDYARTQELVGYATNADGASQEQFEKTLESLESKLNELKNAWDEFTMGITQSGLVKGTVDILTGLLTIVNKLTSGFGETGGAVAKLLVAFMAFKGLKVLKDVIFKSIGSSKDFYKFGGTAAQNYIQGWKIAVQKEKLTLEVETKPMNKDEAFSAFKNTKDAQANYSGKGQAEAMFEGVILNGEEYDPSKIKQYEAAIKDLTGEEVKLTTETPKTASAQQQLGAKLQVASTAAMAASAALAGLSSHLDSKGYSSAAKGIGAISTAFGVLAMILPAIPPVLTAIAGSAAAAEAAMLPVIGVVAAITLVIGGIVAAVSSIETAEEKAERMEKTLQQTQAAIEKLAEEYENLKNSLQSVESESEKLKYLVQGTDEWKESVQNLNKEIRELIKQYPELMDYVDNNNGVLSWNDESAVKDFLNKKENELDMAQAAEYGQELITAKSKKDAAYSSLSAEGKGYVNNKSREEAKEAQQADLDQATKGKKQAEDQMMQHSQTLNDSSWAVSIADSIVYLLKNSREKEKEKETDNLDEYYNAIDKYNNNIQLARTSLGSQAELMASKKLNSQSEQDISNQYLSNIDRIINSIEKNTIKKDSEGRLDTATKDAMDTYFKSIYGNNAKTDSTGNVTYKDENGDLQKMESDVAVAQYSASLALNELADNAAIVAKEVESNSKLTELQRKGLNGEGYNLADLTAITGIENLDTIIKSAETGNNKGINQEATEAWDALSEQAQKAYKDFNTFAAEYNNAVKEAAQDYKKAESIYDTKEQTDNKRLEVGELKSVSASTYGNIANQVKHRGYNSAQGYLDELNNILSNSSLEDGKEMVDYLSTVDWSNLDDAVSAMEELSAAGMDTSQIEKFWDAAVSGAGTYVSTISEALNLMDKIHEKSNDVDDIADKLEKGTATSEDLNKLAAAGVDISGAVRTAEGWQMTSKEIEGAIEKLKEFYALEASKAAEANKKAYEERKQKIENGENVGKFITRGNQNETERKEIEEKQDAIITKGQDKLTEAQKSNVVTDINNRRAISADKMRKSGWTDIKDEDTTIFSSTFTSKDGTKAINVTPILPDGQVLDPKTLEKYANQLLAGEEIVGDNGKPIPILLGGVYEGEDALTQAKADAEELHNYQKELFTNYSFNPNTVTANNVNKMGNEIGLDQGEDETTEDYIERVKQAYIDATNAMNNFYQAQNALEKEANYQRAITMTSSENEVNGGSKESIIQSAEHEATEAGIDLETVRAYREELEKVNGLSAANAAQIATYNAKMNAGLGEIIDSYDEWTGLIDKSTGKIKVSSAEEAKIYEDLRKSANKMLNTSEDLSDAFWDNAENIKNIKEAAEGDTEALEKLQKAASYDYLANNIARTEEAKNALQEFENTMNNIDIPQLKAGVEWNDEGAQKAIQSFNEMARASNLSAEQIQESVKAMGFDAEIEYKEETREVPGESTTRVIDERDPVTNEPIRWHTQVTPTQPTPITGWFPVVKTLTSSGAGGGGVSIKNKKAAAGNKGKSSGGKGGGGKPEKKKDWKNPYDKLYNLTEKINENLRQREKLETVYNRLLKNRKVSGENLLKQSQKEIENLEKQAELQRQMLKGRKSQIDSIGQETWTDDDGNKHTFSSLGVTQYANYNAGTGTIEIDWDAINQVKDEDKGSAIEAYISKLEELVGKYEDTEDALFEIEDQIEEIKQRGIDEAISLEDRVVNAIVDSRQKQIDELQSLSDTIDESNQKVLEGLREQIELERQIRDNTKTEEDITDKENRLAYLQRDTSGANDLEILQLQKELDEARENYTDTLIDQAITQMEKDNQLAAEQRAEQISIMSQQLAQDETNGVITAQAMQYIANAYTDDGTVKIDSELVTTLKNAENFGNLTDLGKEQWMKDLVTQFNTAYEGFKNGYIDIAKNDKNGVSALDRNGKSVTATWDSNKGQWKVGNNYYDASALSWDVNDRVYRLNADTTTQATSNNSGSTGAAQPPRYDNKTKYGVALAIINGGYGWGNGKTRTNNLQRKGFNPTEIQGIVNHLLAEGKVKNGKWVGAYYGIRDLKPYALSRFAKGGLADFTGPAWLDGTKSKPEMVLNPKDTENFIQLKNILANVMSGVTENTNGQGGDNYFDIKIEVAEIANDYDVDQLADRLKKQIYDDASYRNVNFINYLK